ALALHNRAELIERLANNDDDLYLFANPPEDCDIVRQSILANPLVVYARADHPLAQARHISMARLAQEPFLMRERGSGTRRAVEAAFARQRLVPDVRLELASDESIKQAVLAGLGVSVLAQDTFGVDVDQPHLVTLDVAGFPLERHWWFVYPVGRRLSPVASAFMNFVRERTLSRSDDSPPLASRATMRRPFGSDHVRC
ncbi:MAG: LysR substrate-binding domain-containing protein, partial [Casimicrobiaceae bacterium]